jgi:hypothetical protein
MRYFRVVLKVEDSKFYTSDIVEQNIDDQTFESMNWDKPLIRHVINNETHLIALEKEYLECLIAGIQIYLEMI